MKKEKHFLKIKETYIIEDGDSFTIERTEKDGKICFIFCINEQKIESEMILNIEIGTSKDGKIEINVLRAFSQKDFDEIKEIYL